MRYLPMNTLEKPRCESYLVKSGKWKVKSGKWNGEWGMGNGECGKWKVGNW